MLLPPQQQSPIMATNLKQRFESLKLPKIILEKDTLPMTDPSTPPPPPPLRFEEEWDAENLDK
ncbi:hypothetical protein BLA29_014690 [Euroglyphus maynei]|uniref:Uncharacterized protein n=1 Tax=Euroglyphus maynei TaxID=6958 RepID=A0A1Y3BGE1_EURMA|nr:hypothetical protein BLA29_014690 [Euroglyphus maynei]